MPCERKELAEQVVEQEKLSIMRACELWISPRQQDRFGVQIL